MVNDALSIASTALKAFQKLSAFAANNVANADTPNYSRRIASPASLSVNGLGSGVTIGSIGRNSNQYLANSVRGHNSSVGKTEAINKYFDRIQSLFGSPGSKANLNSSLTDFFHTLNNLSINSDDPTFKRHLTTSAENLTYKISELAKGLYELQSASDAEIVTNVNNINNSINRLQEINGNLMTLDSNTDAYASLLDERDVNLNNLAYNLNINVYNDTNNRINVNTSNGISLVDANSLSSIKLNYNPVISVSNFVDNNNLSPLEVLTLDRDNAVSSRVNLITAGKTESSGVNTNIQSVLSNGSLLSLKQLRDDTIPKMLDQLNQLATVITDEFNKVHNSGSGWPPSTTSLTGTRPTSLSEVRQYEGNVRIGLIDKNGNPLEKTDKTFLNPLNLDLSTLKSGSYSGQADVQTVIKEINQYFYNDQISNRTTLGNLYDIKMAASAPLTSAPNGQFTFDFQLTNNSYENSSFEVMNVAITDPGCAGLVGTLPSASGVEAGSRERTNLPITVDFNGGGGGPYTIAVQVKVTDDDGNISNATINYIIDNNPANLNIQNNRYVASSINSASDTAAIIPGSGNGFLQANLVDASGNPITNNSEIGFLQLKTTNGTYFISIDELDSNEKGIPQNSGNNKFPTNKGFSHFFELNNFFTRNSLNDKNSNDPLPARAALNMKVRQDIINNPDLISIARLSKSPVKFLTEEAGASKASGSIKFAGNPSASDVITIDGVDFTFVSSAPANDSEIEIGITLVDTLTNIAAKLNAINSTTSGSVSLATYTSNNADTINVNFNENGDEGNSFSLAGHFSSIGAIINDQGIATTNPSGKLQGGSYMDTTQIINPWTFGLGISNRSAIADLANLSSQRFDWKSTGILSGSFSTISERITSIIDMTISQSVLAQKDYNEESSAYNSLNDKLTSMGGISVDQELANIIKYQQLYAASAKIITMVKEMDQALLNAI